MSRAATMRALLLATAFLLPPAAAANTLLDSAKDRFEAGQYQESVRILEDVLKGLPNDAAVHHWLGRSYFELRNWDRAIESAQRATTLDARNAEAFYWLGKAYSEKADEERSLSLGKKAGKAFKQAVELDPKHIRARRNLIVWYLRMPRIFGGSEEEARKQVEAIAALDPVQGALANGLFWRVKEKWDRAEAEYGRVFDLRPSTADPYLEVADLGRKRLDAAGLKRATEAAAQVNPSEPRLAFYRGVMYAVSGERLDEGERLLLSYVKNVPQRSDYPSHALAHEWLGKLYERMGRCREARASYERALQLDRKLRDAKENLKRLKC